MILTRETFPSLARMTTSVLWKVWGLASGWMVAQRYRVGLGNFQPISGVFCHVCREGRPRMIFEGPWGSGCRVESPNLCFRVRSSVLFAELRNHVEGRARVSRLCLLPLCFLRVTIRKGSLVRLD